MKDKYLYLILGALIVGNVVLTYRNIVNRDNNKVEFTNNNVLPVNEDKELVRPDEVRQYVGAIVEREGLNVGVVDRVVNCESRFNPKIESRTGKFKGLWQIGSMHKIDDSCKFDAVCSTRWAMEKIKRDKSMRAWECYSLTI